MLLAVSKDAPEVIIYLGELLAVDVRVGRNDRDIIAVRRQNRLGHIRRAIGDIGNREGIIPAGIRVKSAVRIAPYDLIILGTRVDLDDIAIPDQALAGAVATCHAIKIARIIKTDRGPENGIMIGLVIGAQVATTSRGLTGHGALVRRRSEEHTSELQSRPHLVC